MCRLPDLIAFCVKANCVLCNGSEVSALGLLTTNLQAQLLNSVFVVRQWKGFNYIVLPAMFLQN
jgi:hypothetical protein